MTPIFEQSYRGYLLQVRLYPTGRYGYLVTLDGQTAAESAGNYISLSIAATNGIIDIDRLANIPNEAEQIAQLIAQREQGIIDGTID